MIIAVIDAQGAGIGQSVIKKIRKETGRTHNIIALGTNAKAGTNMIDAGADEVFTGEASICRFLNENDVDCIIGPIGIICNGGIDGEISDAISSSIFNSNCNKYIVPLRKHGIYIPGTWNLEIKDMINEIVREISKKGCS